MTKVLEFTRAQYMSATRKEQPAAHRRYYAQWVTPNIRDMVTAHFGLDLLLASKDPHLNDIPLARWDRLARRFVRAEDNSLGSRVCTLKEAAKQVIERARAWRHT